MTKRFRNTSVRAVKAVECLLHVAFRWKNRRVEPRFAEIEGRLVCIGLQIGPSVKDEVFQNVEEEDLKPLRAAEIRLPLRELIDRALEIGTMSRKVEPGSDPYEVAVDMLSLLDASRAEGSKRPGRPRLHGSEHFAKVAAIYRNHLASGGRAPTKAVAQHFKTTKSTAAKWVARARELGELERYGAET